MEPKSPTDQVDPSPKKALKDVNAITKVDRREAFRKRRHSWFEWLQLLATILIPVVIAVYTILDNKNNATVADGNRLKDLYIANISRTSALEIAQDNRKNEIEIAEQSREKDRDLAADQQYQNILAAYQTFLANLILENGITLNKIPTAQFVGQLMTLTALNQLDIKRKSFLLRSLHDARLIALEKKSKPSDAPIISLKSADLSNMTLGLSPNLPDKYALQYYITWEYLWLPETYLVNTSFRRTIMDCVNFFNAIMDSVDLSFVAHRKPICFETVRQSQTSFVRTSLAHANLYKANLYYTDFTSANLTFANMHGFICRECRFWSTILFGVDLSSSRFYHTFILHNQRLHFQAVDLRQAVVRSSYFRTMDFDKADWSNVQASEIDINNCSFSNAKMENCSLMNSIIQESLFQNASLYSADFSNATLYNVSFVHADMRNVNLSHIRCDYCDFTNVTLHGAVLKNASLRHSNFLNCQITSSQLKEATDLFGSRLPNGTFVNSNTKR